MTPSCPLQVQWRRIWLGEEALTECGRGAKARVLQRKVVGKPSGNQGDSGTGSDETLFRCYMAAEPTGPEMVSVAKWAFDQIVRVTAHESPGTYLQPCLPLIHSSATMNGRPHTPALATSPQWSHCHEKIPSACKASWALASATSPGGHMPLAFQLLPLLLLLCQGPCRNHTVRCIITCKLHRSGPPLPCHQLQASA